MRHQISFALAIAALLLASGCEKVGTAPQPRALATYGGGTSMAADSAGVGAITSRSIMPPAADGFVAGRTVKVAVLLPLTGRNAELGRALQDAATVSLFDKYATLSSQQQTVTVELLPKDTGDTPEQAVRAMNEAITDGAAFVIGPLFADATEAVAPIARAKGISMLSLSNNTAKADEGVYMYGFSPQEQTTRVVNYALFAGKSRIAALVPDSALGALVLQSAKTALAAQGITLVKVVTHSAQGVGLDVSASALLPEAGSAPEFDALLLPEGGPALGTMLRALEARGISSRNVQLLGTGIWDDAALVRRVPLEGAWLASSPPKATAAFEARFRATYQYMPPRIASLAYDAVALAVTLATSGRPFDSTTLTSAAGFTGPANGVFRLRPMGRVERGLAVLQVQAGTFKEISPAPPGFQQ